MHLNKKTALFILNLTYVWNWKLNCEINDIFLASQKYQSEFQTCVSHPELLFLHSENIYMIIWFKSILKLALIQNSLLYFETTLLHFEIEILHSKTASSLFKIDGWIKASK